MNVSALPFGTGILQSPWSAMTLPGLLAGAARLRADAPFVSDGPAFEALAHQPGLRLTCGALKSASDRLAAQLLALGIEPGDVVLLHLPNAAHAMVALLGVLAAGAVPAPVPLFEDVDALKSAADLTGASAILTIASFAGLRPAEKCREAAVDRLGLRIVAAFGEDLPEGVVPLDHCDLPDTARLPAHAASGAGACLVTFDRTAGMHRALMRSHEQIIAEAAAAAGLVRSGAGDRLLVTIPPATIAGVVFGIALPLLTGASVDLVPLFDSCALAGQLSEAEPPIVVLPGQSELAFRQFCEENALACEGLVLVHRPDRARPALPVPEAGHVRCLDVLCLGEAAMALSRRDGGGDAAQVSAELPHPVAGVIAEDRPLLTFSIDGAGTLHASGPCCPQPLALSAASACTTGFSAVSTEIGTIRLVACAQPLSDAA